MAKDKIKVVAGTIIQYGNKILMCKRAEKQAYGGEWSIPLGSAKREFFEETNIKLTGDIKLIDIITKEKGTMIYVYYKNSGKELMPDLENAKDGSEHTECGYFSYDELPFGDKQDEIYDIIKKVLGDRK
jgi:ADP-ribose pyrophosphatase YjhB (NUDIX family)